MIHVGVGLVELSKGAAWHGNLLHGQVMTAA
jgi:hypothetical protein